MNRFQTKRQLGGEQQTRQRNARPTCLHPQVDVAQRFVIPGVYRLRPSSTSTPRCSQPDHTSSTSSGIAQVASSSPDVAATVTSLETPSRGTKRTPAPPRLRSACSQCVRAKKACGGHLPCSRCVRLGEQCMYELRKQARLQSRSARKSNGAGNSHPNSDHGRPVTPPATSAKPRAQSRHEPLRRGLVSPNPLPIAKLLTR
ncbi:unnamed protein product [Choristocarpus tenellus]